MQQHREEERPLRRKEEEVEALHVVVVEEEKRKRQKQEEVGALHAVVVAQLL